MFYATIRINVVPNVDAIRSGQKRRICVVLRKRRMYASAMPAVPLQPQNLYLSFLSLLISLSSLNSIYRIPFSSTFRNHWTSASSTLLSCCSIVLHYHSCSSIRSTFVFSTICSISIEFAAIVVVVSLSFSTLLIWHGRASVVCSQTSNTQSEWFLV